MMKILLPITFMLMTLPLRAQTDPSTLEDYIENLAESMAEQLEDEVDLQTYAQSLYDFARAPINLNTARRDELEELQMLSDFQILSLLDYRKKHGQIISFNELYFMAGFNTEVVQLIKPFVTLKKADEHDERSFKQKLAFQQHDFVVGLQRKFPLAVGYQQQQNQSGETTDPVYRGNAWKMQGRYRFTVDPQLELGGIIEKDPGEPFWTSGGFDYQTAYALWKADKTLKTLVAGDFHAQTGQGLLYFTGYSPGKTTYLSSIQKRGARLRGNFSATEANYLRGIGTEFRFKTVHLLLFGSSILRDASIDSLAGIPVFSSVYTAGYHRTAGEAEKRHQLNEKLLGGSLRFEQNHIQVGINALHLQYDKEFQPGSNNYTSQWPTGSTYWGASVDYRLIAGKYQLYGETSFDGKAWASMNALLAYIDSRTTFTWVHRYYQAAYYAPHSNAFSEGSRVNNEQGLFMGLEIHPVSGWRVAGFIDAFTFPWLRYQTDAPSNGYDAYIESACQLNDTWEYSIRYKAGQKEENVPNETGFKESGIGKNDNHALRIGLRYVASSAFDLKTRIEHSWTKNQSPEVLRGWLVYQDVKFHREKQKLQLTARFAWFHCPEYDTRIYAYENDVRYSFSVPAYYGIGYRTYAMLNYRPVQKVQIQLRYAYTQFSDRSAISSGPALIRGNSVSELKVQVLIRL